MKYVLRKESFVFLIGFVLTASTIVLASYLAKMYDRSTLHNVEASKRDMEINELYDMVNKANDRISGLEKEVIAITKLVSTNNDRSAGWKTHQLSSTELDGIGKPITSW